MIYFTGENNLVYLKRDIWTVEEYNKGKSNHWEQIGYIGGEIMGFIWSHSYF